MSRFERNQLAKVIQSAQPLKAYCSNNIITQHKNSTIAIKTLWNFLYPVDPSTMAISEFPFFFFFSTLTFDFPPLF